MAAFISVQEFPIEGIAIIEDDKGKYLATKNSPDIIPLYDLEGYFGRKQTCALLQSREAMLT